VERIDGVIVATLRSSDRVINTLPTPIILKFRRAFAHDAIEVPIAPGAVWYAPVTVQESFTVTLRPGSVPMGYKSSASFGWATAAPAPHIATVRSVGWGKVGRGLGCMHERTLLSAHVAQTLL
jgi:hypothetical protein